MTKKTSFRTKPFSIGKDLSAKLPEDCTTIVYGANHASYDTSGQYIISAASCTTTGLAHMIKPLLETAETSKILTASMSTVHAATSTQNILDSLPRSGTSDFRKNRSILNNIIIASTGAAQTLEKVLPEIKKVGFMADSVRIPINTVSLISLNITFHTPISSASRPILTQDFINEIYKKAANGPQKGLLIYTERQNVSSDLIGYEAAIVIEGHETHTRTGFITLPLEILKRQNIKSTHDIQVPVTHAKIFGWYDNELGSYGNCLSELTVYIYKNMG